MTAIAPVKDRTYWTKVLHNAAKVPVDHPRYGEARQVIQLALDNIGTQMEDASAQDPENAPPSKTLGRAVAFGQGASLGLADTPLMRMGLAANPMTAGLLQLFGSSPAEHQDFLSQARGHDPVGTTIADVLGMGATSGILAGTPLFAGLTPTQTGTAIGIGTGAVRGAAEPIPGISRGMSALIYGTAGGIAGPVVGKLVGKLLPIATRVMANARGILGRALGRAVTQAEVQGVSEGAVRAELQRLNVRPELIERTVEAWRTGKVSTTPIPAPTPPPQPPVAMRPGETLTPIAPKGLEVTGVRATPPATGRPPTILEMQQGLTPSKLADLSTGQTLPYYSRGGQAAEAILPGSTGAATVQATSQQGIQMQQLQYLAKLPAADFEAAAQSGLFSKEITDMVRAVRLQMGIP